MFPTGMVGAHAQMNRHIANGAQMAENSRMTREGIDHMKAKNEQTLTNSLLSLGKGINFQ